MPSVSFPSTIELDKPFTWTITGVEELIRVKVCVGSVIDEDTVFIFNGNRATYNNLATLNYDQEFFNKESDDGPRTPFTTTGTYTLQFFSREYGAFENSYDLLIDTKTINVSEPVLTINYPTTIKQRQEFHWNLTGAKPGESLYLIVTGPTNRQYPTVNIDNDRSWKTTVPAYFEYAGTYQLQFVFSRSGTITRTIEVTPKLYINYPQTAYAGKPFDWSVSGGEPNETWTAELVGPITFTVSGFQLDSIGNSNYTGTAVSTVGIYDVTWNFPLSGKVKRQISVISDGRDGIHPEGTPLSVSEINAEFLTGNDLYEYRGDQWFLKNGDFGNFDSDRLDFSEFYNKKAVDPAIPGSVYYGTPGNYSFVIPLHRGGVTIQAWGGGGGNGTSQNRGGDTNVYFPGNSMYAGGGTGSGGGGRRYFSPGGAGGDASGGHENLNGNGGGNDMGAFWKGGTGAAAPYGGAGGAGGTPYGVAPTNGSSPGGGGGGVTWRDYSSSPGYGGAGGGGSGAYCGIYNISLATGTQIDFNVGGGAQDSYSAGGDGAVKISWS
jgi:hypothetical protein